MDSYSMSKVVSIIWYSDLWKWSDIVLKSNDKKLECVYLMFSVLSWVRMCVSAHLQCLHHTSSSPRLAQLRNVWKKCSNQNVWHSLLPIILIKIVQHPYTMSQKISIPLMITKNYKEQWQFIPRPCCVRCIARCSGYPEILVQDWRHLINELVVWLTAAGCSPAGRAGNEPSWSYRRRPLLD